MTAAAESLVVTQPTVSAAVAALNRELGCTLFERVGRGIRPTAAGEAFAPYAADVIGLLEQGRQRAQEVARTARQRLRIAAVTTAAESFVPPLLRAFVERHPEIEVTLDVGNQAEVLSRVLAHSSDMGFAGRLMADERLVTEPLSQNEIVCITAPDDARLAAPGVFSRDLVDRAWLLREPGSGTRALNEKYLADRGLRPTTLTLGSNGAIKQAVRAGLGVSLVSRVAVADELAAGLLGELRLVDAPATWPWFLLRSVVGAERPSVALFVDFVRTPAVPA